ncbi:MliC family protein [Mesorhizobium xinjiangense]|uniref:MliC family protein n=1 Tax=Mesorhizobium xinjiangense TaxID=2678685 RepID=UPI0012ED2028|nr:MliC family protein [Mesorhizobium xinjiangense]
MRQLSLAAIVLSVLASPAAASALTIDLPGDADVETSTVTYACPDSELTVTYHNAGSVSLAVFETGGEVVVASNVIAASGARYAGGRYVWWTKGDTGDLYDLMQGEDAPPASCTASD